MKIEELKKELKEEIESSETWLRNQYPPKSRYSEKTYMNWQNIRDVFSEQEAEKIEGAINKFMADHPGRKVVVLARLDSDGRVTRPLILWEPHSDYYGQYVLFAQAYNLKGFVEVFHNVKKE